MIEEWATTGGLISDTKVDYLCRCIIDIPLVLCHAGIPLEDDVWDIQHTIALHVHVSLCY